MRRHRANIPLALLTAALLAGLSACGSGGAELLPGTTASQINSNLDQVRQLASEGECERAEGAATEVSSQVEGVKDVDPELKQLLDEGAERLSQVVQTCADSEEEEALKASEEEEDAAAEKEDEEAAKEEKQEKEKPAKEDEPPEPPGDEKEKGNGKGKGNESEAPPEEAGGEAPSGGVGPPGAVEGE